MTQLSQTANEVEIWKDIPGFEGRYAVSNIGNVRSLTRYVNHPKGGKKILNGRVLRPTRSSAYLMINLGDDGSHSVHRLVAITFIPNPERKPQVNHKDGDKHNNALANLEWVTCSENGLHSVRVLGNKCTGPKYNSQRKPLDYTYSKPLAQLVDGKILAVFPNAVVAEKTLGIRRQEINRHCREQRNPRYLKYRLEYIGRDLFYELSKTL